MFLCAVCQLTYFVASYTGCLERVLVGIKLHQDGLRRCRRTVAICTPLTWIILLINTLVLVYSFFLTEGYMDITLAPIKTYVTVSNLLVPRLIVFVVSIYVNAAWIFSHAMTLMLATIFCRQYSQLERAFKQRLADSEKRRISDSEIETTRQRHQAISSSVTETDSFLMFSNAAAFCCQLFGTILLLYSVIFYYSTMNDPIIIVMHAVWMSGQTMGLSVTTAAGIMVNNYVSANAYFLTVKPGYNIIRVHRLLSRHNYNMVYS